MNKRVNRVKVSLGGAIKRKNPSKASILYKQLNLLKGRILDYGCGYGFDAEVNNWESYDPYYNDIKIEGLFDTIVCTNVLSAVSSNSVSYCDVNNLCIKVFRQPVFFLIFISFE